MIDYSALDILLQEIEGEVKSGEVAIPGQAHGFLQKLFGVKRPSLPLNRLRVREEGPFGKVIAWSDDGKEPLDIDAAKHLLDSRIASIGLRTGPGSTTSDDDGSVLQFWEIQDL